jgi:hypothetical protein
MTLLMSEQASCALLAYRCIGIIAYVTPTGPLSIVSCANFINALIWNISRLL